MSEFDQPPESELLDLPRIDVRSLDDGVDADHYVRYERALIAVLKGASARQAAKDHGVRRATLDDVVEESRRMHPDGKPVGFRACLRRRRRIKDPLSSPNIDNASPPRSLNDILLRVPKAAELFARFRGRLPEKNRPSKSFDAFLKRFMAAVESAGHGGLTIWESADRGRRAIIRRLRAARAFVPAPDVEEPPPGANHVTRLDRLFEIEPLDRIEGDEHRTDVNWRVLVPGRSGRWITKAIPYILLTLFIDVGSHAVMGWRIVVGRRFNRFDLLRLAARCLRPWRKRNLIVQGLHYHPEAWMPSAVATGNALRRAASLALDNAMAHLAHDATENLAGSFRGVTNLGYPHNPEGRPHVEGVFKKFENWLFRLLAGGFRPPGEEDSTAIATTNRRPEDYPIQLQALDDLLDVVVSAYNVTAQDALDQRSPKDVFEAHCSNAIVARSTLTDRDATNLVAIRKWVTIRGKRGVRQPYVKWKYAIYRSNGLNGQYQLLNQRFLATIDADDPRRMYLWRGGVLFAVMHAQPPWADTPHDLETRERAERCRARGLLKWEPFGDAALAYESHVREWASQYTWATEEFLRLDLYRTTNPDRTTPAPARQSAIFDLPPRKQS